MAPASAPACFACKGFDTGQSRPHTTTALEHHYSKVPSAPCEPVIVARGRAPQAPAHSHISAYFLTKITEGLGQVSKGLAKQTATSLPLVRNPILSFLIHQAKSSQAVIHPSHHKGEGAPERT